LWVEDWFHYDNLARRTDQSVKSGRVPSGGTTNSTRSDNLPKLNLPRGPSAATRPTT
jgi:hypothetical protein